MKVTYGMIPIRSGDSAHRQSWDRDREDMLPVNATTGWVAVQTAPESSPTAIPDTPPLSL